MARGWMRPALYFAIFLAGAGIVYAALAGLAGSASLGAGAALVEARVTGVRTLEERNRATKYQVQYAFDAGGRTYTYRDATGRTNLWASLEREAWEAARANGTTPVSYLADDPWTSRAVHAAGDPVEENVIGLLAGVVLMLPATLWVVKFVRRRRTAAG